MSSEQASELELVVREALLAAAAVHDRLGEGGLKEVSKNHFGDTALVGDVEAEEAIFRTLNKHGVPVLITSEEHGMFQLTHDPKYLVVIDGIDGSSVYKHARGVGRYGTMLALFDGVDPTFDDYLVSGVMEHVEKRLYIARRQNGASVTNGKGRERLHVSAVADLASAKALQDARYFGRLELGKMPLLKRHIDALQPRKPGCLGASSMHYVDVAQGSADLVLECTRKKSLEIAIAYGIIREAGGVMVDENGASVGPQRYLAFREENHKPIITASTKGLAQDFLNAVASKTY